MIREEISNIKSTAKDLKEFGLVVGFALILIGALLWHFKNYSFLPFAYGGMFLIILGFFKPKLLLWLQKAWMTFGLCMGLVVGTVILTLLYYLIVTPIGLAVKLSGRRLLDLVIDDKKETYWNKRNLGELNGKECEHQY